MTFCRDLLEKNIELRGRKGTPYDPTVAPRFLKVSTYSTRSGVEVVRLGIRGLPDVNSNSNWETSGKYIG